MILVVDMNWKRDSLAFFEFVLPIITIAEKIDNCVIRHYPDVSEKEIDTCNCIILSGTNLKDNITLSQPEKFSWIKTTEKPVLGICAGMQTMGVVFGLKLNRCLELGMVEINTMKDNPLFSGKFKAYSLHNYSVESSGEFEVLAESKQCTQAFKHKQKPVYGVLFHPEVRNEEIIKNFVIT